MSDIVFGSVCSGIEAASVAWHPLGWRASWLAEIESFPRIVLAHHYPNVPNLGDMTAIAAMVRAGTVAAPDVLVGGTPCQAYSVAGLRHSLDDPRGQLTLSFVDLANAIDTARLVRGEPAAVIVWENVPGVLNTKDNAFGCFLGGLAGEDCALVAPRGKWPHAGCVFGPQRTVAWRVLDAQYFGVAQRRRRVFVVASARPGFDPAAVLFEREGLRRDTAPSRKKGQDAAAGTLRSTGGGCDVDHARAGHLQLIDAAGMPSAPGVVSTLDASYGRLQGASGQDANHGHSHLLPMAFGGNNQSGEIDVAAGLNANRGCHNPGDFESGTLLAYAFQPRIARNGRGDMGEVVSALTAQAGETGKGDAAPCVAYAIQEAAARTNPTSGPNGVGVQSDIAYTIEARRDVQAVCFSSKDSGNDATLDLAPTMRAMGHSGSHANGGGQLAVAFCQNTRDEVRLMNGDGQIVGALSAQSGTHQTCYVALDSEVLPFDTTQITSPANRSSPQVGDPCHPLAAGAHPPAVCFKPSHYTRGKDGAPSEISPPLSADADKGDQEALVLTAVCIHADAVGRTGEAITPSADAEGRVRLRDPGMGVIEDGTSYNLMASGKPHAVCVAGDDATNVSALAFQERGRAGGPSLEVNGDLAYALTAPSGGGRAQERNVLTITTPAGSDGARVTVYTGDGVTADPISANEAKTYTHEGVTFRMHNVVQRAAMAVRRLTPRECERLQAFPDDYTLIPLNKITAVRAAALRAKGEDVLMIDGQAWKLSVDGPRYKALGNSMCVFNMRWIGARIAAALAVAPLMLVNVLESA